MTRQHTSAERKRNHRQAQMRIHRRCSCGRVITGNAAWWSHMNAKANADGHHTYEGRA